MVGLLLDYYYWVTGGLINSLNRRAYCERLFEVVVWITCYLITKGAIMTELP